MSFGDMAEVLGPTLTPEFVLPNAKEKMNGSFLVIEASSIEEVKGVIESDVLYNNNLVSPLVSTAGQPEGTPFCGCWAQSSRRVVDSLKLPGGPNRVFKISEPTRLVADQLVFTSNKRKIQWSRSRLSKNITTEAFPWLPSHASLPITAYGKHSTQNSGTPRGTVGRTRRETIPKQLHPF